MSDQLLCDMMLANVTELTEVCRDSELKELIGSLQMTAYSGDTMMPVT